MSKPLSFSSDKKTGESHEHIETRTAHNGEHSTVHEYSRNTNAKIRNPLAGIPKEELLTDVDIFCSGYGLEEHAASFRKGALLAQSPDEFEDIVELTEDDKVTIRREKTHKWHLPRALYFTIVICSLGSAIQ
ncbi:hypothetical protein PVAG01_07944 [Phlyctema vagabunda]|uniref:Uncharacterized protein n=1 Tax=Phlyctema vagabunda TaxID=108571 RepID=A0ABR4PDY9_9HELO